MSTTTDAVIVATWLDDWDTLVAQFIAPIPGIEGITQRFREVPSDVIGTQAGGPKAMMTRLFLAGFNNIDVDHLCRWFQKLPWRSDVDNAALVFDTEGRFGSVTIAHGSLHQFGYGARSSR